MSPAEIRANSAAKKRVTFVTSSLESPATGPYHSRAGR
jgi:hypothetical protein